MESTVPLASLLALSPALATLLGRASRRVLALRLLSVATWAVAAGFLAATLFLVAHRLLSPAWSALLPFAALALGTPVVTLLAGLVLLRRDRFDAALALDRHYRLDERLTSILMLDEAALPRDTAVALVRDGETRAARADLRAALPIGRPRGSLPAAGAVLLAGAAWLFVPGFDLLGIQEAGKKATIERERIAARDETLRKHLDSLRKIADENQISLEARELLAQLAERKRLDAVPRENREARREALVELDRMRQDLEKLRERPAMKALDEFLEKVAEKGGLDIESPKLASAARALVQGDLDKAAERLKELAEQMRNDLKDCAKQNAAQLGALQKDLAQLAQLLANMPSQALSSASPLGIPPDLLQKLLSGDLAENLPELSEQMARQLAELARLMREDELLASAQDQIELTEQELASLPEELQDLELCEDCKKGGT